MGMGYGANYADVISKEDIIKVCGNPAKEFFDYLKEDGAFDAFALAVDRDCAEYADGLLDEKEFYETFALLKDMCSCFAKETNGLTIGLYYHDSKDDGDRYDDVSGGFFHVEGMYQLTPEGKALNNKEIYVVRSFYVTFG